MPLNISVFDKFSSDHIPDQHKNNDLVKQASRELPPELDAWARKFAQFFGLTNVIRTLLQTHFDLLTWELHSGKLSPMVHKLEAKHLMLFVHEVDCALNADSTDIQQFMLYRLFEYQNIKQYRLFDRLLQSDYYPGNFRFHLNLLNKSVALGWVSNERLLIILTQASIFGRSLLHELLLRPTDMKDTDNLICYLDAIDRLRGLNVLNHDAYLELFTAENKHGFSIMHQAINAPSFVVARQFIRWFKDNVYFSPEDRSLLIHYKSQKCKNPAPGSLRPPRRVQGKDGGFEINCQMNELKTRFPRSPAQCEPAVRTPGSLSERGLNTFFPTVPIVEDNQSESWVRTWVPRVYSSRCG